MYTSGFVHMSTGTCKDQGHQFPLDLELKEVVSHPLNLLVSEVQAGSTSQLLLSLMVISRYWLLQNAGVFPAPGLHHHNKSLWVFFRDSSPHTHWKVSVSLSVPFMPSKLVVCAWLLHMTISGCQRGSPSMCYMQDHSFYTLILGKRFSEDFTSIMPVSS